jgi:hypothetical protein
METEGERAFVEHGVDGRIILKWTLNETSWQNVDCKSLDSGQTSDLFSERYLIFKFHQFWRLCQLSQQPSPSKYGLWRRLLNSLWLETTQAKLRHNLNQVARNPRGSQFSLVDIAEHGRPFYHTQPARSPTPVRVRGGTPAAILMSLLRAASFIKFVPQLISCNLHPHGKYAQILIHSSRTQFLCSNMLLIFHKSRCPVA